jgi:N-acetylneuraminic acid mutarotase
MSSAQAAGSNNWAWIKGTSIVDQAAVYGARGVPAGANTPGGRGAAATWTDSAGNFWFFGGEGLITVAVALSDLWKFNPTTTNWTWMKGPTNYNQRGVYGTRGVPAATNTPGARYWTMDWPDTSGALWLFGGYGYGSSGPAIGCLNDLWKYNPATTNWTWMKGSEYVDQQGVYGTRGVPAPGNVPGGRYGSAAWTDASGALWLFGGYGYDSWWVAGYLSDLWKYNPATTNWTWIKGSTSVDESGVYGTLGVPANGNFPGGRRHPMAWLDADGALWLFGGEGYDASGSLEGLNDLWKFDPLTTNWTWIHGSTNGYQHAIYGTRGVPAASNTPGARQYAKGWRDPSGALCLFGGYLWNAGWLSCNDLLKFDPATTNWTWIKGSTNANQAGVYGTRGVPADANTPGARRSLMAWANTRGIAWVFGGFGYDGEGTEGRLNDVWIYNSYGAMALGSNALAFNAACQGTNPPAQTVALTNIGTRGIAYTNVIVYGGGITGWLTVSPAAGTLAPGGAVILTNQVNVAGLGTGTFYAVNQVTADADNSPRAVVVTLTVTSNTAPTDMPAPTGLTASEGTYSNQVQLAWNAVTGATGYLIYRSLTNTTASAAQIDVSGSTTYADTGAAAWPGIALYYWVKAYWFVTTNYSPASDFSASARGYCAATPSSLSADLAACGLVFLPPAIAAGANPDSAAFVIRNNGPDNLADSAGCDFFLSRSEIFSPAEVVWIGGFNRGLQLNAGDQTNVTLAAADLASLTIPSDATGNYYVFVNIRAATIPDPDLSNNITRRSEAISIESGGGSLKGPVAGDFDGDGKADPALYQESSGLWSAMLSSLNYGIATATFGGSGHTPVAKDFDGDGRADLGIYNQLTGDWAVMLSGNNYLIATLAGFGGVGYAPVATDYDGDGRADPAIYEESTGSWLVKLSASDYGTAVLGGFGGVGYAALGLDFDGDGRADPAIYQSSSGAWQVKLSGSGYADAALAGFGGPTWQQVAGRFDNDARADAAIYEAASGTWHAMLSASSYITADLLEFGGTGYVPVVADFDGDGLADPALYQAATSTWFVKLSASSYVTVSAQQ